MLGLYLIYSTLSDILLCKLLCRYGMRGVTYNWLDSKLLK